MTTEPLPDFKKPPVTEVVCGVLFQEIPGFLAPYLGLLWDKFKADYPQCQEVAPLVPAIERFERQEPSGPRITDIPPMARTWFVHEKGNGIIQVQRDRFLHNWRKIRAEDEYPHYDHVFRQFKKALAAFREFLAEEDLGSVEIRQYEMTYINHIPKGEGWNSLSDLGAVLPDFSWRKNDRRALPPFESVNLRTSFVLPDKQGRLHLTIRDAVRRADDLPILMVELTARGIGEDTSLEAMDSWFALAHESIVRGFADLTDQEVQKKHWERLR